MSKIYLLLILVIAHQTFAKSHKLYEIVDQHNQYLKTPEVVQNIELFKNSIEETDDGDLYLKGSHSTIHYALNSFNFIHSKLSSQYEINRFMLTNCDQSLIDELNTNIYANYNEYSVFEELEFMNAIFYGYRFSRWPHKLKRKAKSVLLSHINDVSLSQSSLISNLMSLTLLEKAVEAKMLPDHLATKIKELSESSDRKVIQLQKQMSKKRIGTNACSYYNKIISQDIALSLEIRSKVLNMLNEKSLH